LTAEPPFIFQSMTTTTTTTTAATTATTTTSANVRSRRGLRRQSTSSTPLRPRLQLCHSLSDSPEALDPSAPSPTQTLASLRFLVLSYLSDVETRLSQLEASISDLRIAEALKAKGELTIEEARAWARTALEMLDCIRADVLSHLPEFHFVDMSIEEFVKSHLPDTLDVQRLNDVRSHLPDMTDMRSHLPDMPDVRSRLPDFTLSDVRSKFEDVRTRFYDLDFKRPLTYIPTLSNHLRSLHSHLSSMELPSGFEFTSLAPSAVLSDLLEALHCSDLFSDLVDASSDVREAEDMLERAAKDIARAVKRSLQGTRLIDYVDLPAPWQNNPHVIRGYRCVHPFRLS
jgi:adiponectin receptor